MKTGAFTLEAALWSVCFPRILIVYVVDGIATKSEGESGIPAVLPAACDGPVGNWAHGAGNQDELSCRLLEETDKKGIKGI